MLNLHLNVWCFDYPSLTILSVRCNCSFKIFKFFDTLITTYIPLLSRLSLMSILCWNFAIKKLWCLGDNEPKFKGKMLYSPFFLTFTNWKKYLILPTSREMNLSKMIKWVRDCEIACSTRYTFSSIFLKNELHCLF